MRRIAVILAIVLFAALLHTGAMAGFSALMELSSGGAISAHDHAAATVPFCPIGSVCPFVQQAPMGFALLVVLIALAALAAVVARVPRLAVPFRCAPLEPFPPPNSPKFLLSVFKRE